MAAPREQADRPSRVRPMLVAAALALSASSAASAELPASADGGSRIALLNPGLDTRWSRTLELAADPTSAVAVIRQDLDAGRNESARAASAALLELGAGDDVHALWIAAGGTEPSPWTRGRIDAGRWYPPLPDVEIPLLDGGSFRPADVRGEMLLLDFWATWCEPCLREMPQLQALADEWRGRGLRVVTVNSGEPPAIARDYLDALGVDLPAGSYDDAVREALPLRTLPTLLLIDADGRMRRRWSGYSDGLIELVSRRVRELLSPDGSATERVAEIRSGAGLLSLGWSRRSAGTAGLAIMPFGATGAMRLVTATDAGLVVHDAEGELLGQAPVDPAAGELVVPPPGHADVLLGFRRGGRRLVRIGAELDGVGLDAPSYLLDVAFAGEGAIWAATVDGLYRLDGDGSVDVADGTDPAWVAVGDPGEVRAVAEIGGRPAALRAPASLALHESSGRVARVPLPEGLDDVWLAEPTPDGGVVVGDGGIARVAVAEWGDGRRAVVVATRSGHLVLLDAADGRVLHRSVWDGPLSALTTGDLDGDGRDELAVVAGTWVCLLRLSPDVD